jgi:exodeoxyribonuclease VII large subunit
VSKIQPSGEGSLKKAYELLKKKLTAEGLFDPSKKRPLPEISKIGVISSTQAAGYADFIKILNARWGGIKVIVAHTQVQGLDAPEQIIRALNYFNEHGEVDIVAILRGGGSADDLACFNDEALVRAIAASKIPVICGIGHEVDESLSDLAADIRASTPSNAAELLTKDRKEESARLKHQILHAGHIVIQQIDSARSLNNSKVRQIAASLNYKYIDPMYASCNDELTQVLSKIQTEFSNISNSVEQKIKLLSVLNPEKVLAQGYSILSGKISPGNVVKITTLTQQINAEVKEVYDRKKES